MHFSAPRTDHDNKGGKPRLVTRLQSSWADRMSHTLFPNHKPLQPKPTPPHELTLDFCGVWFKEWQKKSNQIDQVVNYRTNRIKVDQVYGCLWCLMLNYIYICKWILKSHTLITVDHVFIFQASLQSLQESLHSSGRHVEASLREAMARPKKASNPLGISINWITKAFGYLWWVLLVLLSC